MKIHVQVSPMVYLIVYSRFLPVNDMAARKKVSSLYHICTSMGRYIYKTEILSTMTSVNKHYLHSLAAVCTPVADVAYNPSHGF